MNVIYVVLDNVFYVPSCTFLDFAWSWQWYIQPFSPIKSEKWFWSYQW